MAALVEEGTISLSGIKSAAELLRGRVLRTPVLEAPKLSALTGARIFIKYENMQATGSFKERGAFLKLLSLDAAARERGVIAISAGITRRPSPTTPPGSAFGHDRHAGECAVQ